MSLLVALPEELYAHNAFAAFQPGAAFSPGNCRAMAWASQLAYEYDDIAKIDRILGLWNLERTELLAGDVTSVLPMTSTRVIVFSRGDALVVAFKGTDPLVLADWITDFSVRPRYSGIHEGFDAALNAVWPKLAALLQSEGRGKQLFVTGHSLGGALAVLAALRMQQSGAGTVSAHAVYTFGMPRCGTVEFSSDYSALNDITYRFVYDDDIVPRVPPTDWGFRHVGRRFSCARRGRFQTSSWAKAPIDDDPPFVNSIAANISSVFALHPVALPGLMRGDLIGRVIELLPPPLRDHLPDRYIGAV